MSIYEQVLRSLGVASEDTKTSLYIIDLFLSEESEQSGKVSNQLAVLALSAQAAERRVRSWCVEFDEPWEFARVHRLYQPHSEVSDVVQWKSNELRFTRGES